MFQTLRQLGNLVRTARQFPAAEFIFAARRPCLKSAATLLHIPTSDGSGEACHVSVVQTPGGFAGYSFWMINTPYPLNTHKLENPELFGSHDGIFWQVPPGVANPLVAAPGGDDRHYHSDPCLLHHEDRLILYFRTSDEESRPRRDWISIMSTVNGRDWSEPRIVLDGPRGRLLLCPTVRVMGGQFHMWTVDRTDGPLLTICRRTSPDGEHWSAPEPNELNWPDEPLEPWHIDVVQQGSQMILIFSGRAPRRRRTQLFYCATGNGKAWDVHGPLEWEVCAFEGGKAYKPSLVSVGNDSCDHWLYTSTKGLDGRWYTALRPWSFSPC